MAPNLKSFIKRIIIPTVATIILFLLTFFTFFIPRFEQVVMERKREMIKELTNNALSVLAEFHQKELKKILTTDAAQSQAKKIINDLRYGPENKDYFWITDTRPFMVMHPYRADLNGKDVSNFKDEANNRPFVLFVDVAQKSGAGYVNYMWQWKDNPRRIVPKLSYVSLFRPWNWVIGTGIYVEDVKAEIQKITSHIITITLLITFIISLILLYIIQQSKKIEAEKERAQLELIESKEKYRSIVEAGREGVAMIREDRFIYLNQILCNILEYSLTEIQDICFFQIFLHQETSRQAIRERLKNATEGKVEYFAELVTKHKNVLKLTLEITQITYTKQPAFIVIFKDTKHLLTGPNLNDVQSSDLLVTLKSFNKKLDTIARKPLIIDMEATISEATQLMMAHNETAFLVKAQDKIVGILTNFDLRNYILLHQSNPALSVFKLMSAPIITCREDATIFDAIMVFQEKNISHLGIANSANDIVGIVELKDIIKNLDTTFGQIVKKITQASQIYELKKIYSEVHKLVYVLISSGTNGRHAAQILGKISDSIMEKVINIALEKYGPAPSRFAFIALGSVARMEQTLVTDQDNALIFPDENIDQTYFANLTHFICQALHTIGYNLCKGKLMASETKWRTTLSNWKNNFAKWIKESGPNELTTISIFFDLRLIYGDSTLSAHLIADRNCIINDSDTFLRNLAQKTCNYKIPINLFGNISDRFNIKHMLRIVVDFVRIYALQHQLEETNTFDRLDRLYSLKAFNKLTYESILNSLEFLTKLRLTHQSNLIMQNLPPDNYINPERLNEFDHLNLKKSLNEIQSLQAILTSEFLQNV